jgi:hypothetical protein
MFAVSPSMNKPCLFFVDFNDSIVCYDNIQVLSDNNDNKGDKSMHKIRVIQR